MITPLDIQNKEFKKSLRGYSSKEVDIFLDNINNDYEKLYRENIELKDKIGMLTDQIRQYNNLEETLKSTLVLAQSTADDVTASARKKAELLIEEADLRAQTLIRNAMGEVKDINMEYDSLHREMFLFKTKYKSFMQAQLMSLEEFYKDQESEKDHKSFEDTKIESQDEDIEDIQEDDNIEVDDLGA